jgi:hypothetical protein
LELVVVEAVGLNLYSYGGREGCKDIVVVVVVVTEFGASVVGASSFLTVVALLADSS